MTSEPRLLPLAACAATLGIASADLRRAVERGEVPYVRVGDRGILLPVEEVVRVLAERARRAVRAETPEVAP